MGARRRKKQRARALDRAVMRDHRVAAQDQRSPDEQAARIAEIQEQARASAPKLPVEAMTASMRAAVKSRW